MMQIELRELFIFMLSFRKPEIVSPTQTQERRYTLRCVIKPSVNYTYDI
jgi:hypothetical protein